MKAGLAKSLWYFVTFVFLFILAAGLIGTPPARGQDVCEQDACDPTLYHYIDTFTEPDGAAAGWTPGSGTWGVENGEYSGSIDPGLMANTFITGTGGLSDYKVEVSVFPIGPDDDMGWRAGVIVRAKAHPGSNGYDGYLIHSYREGLRIYKLVNDEVVESIYGEGGYISANAWHTLGVEAKDNELKFYYNGTPIYTVIDNSLGGYPPFSSGMIGLRVWGHSGPPHVHFDNFKYCGQTISNAVLAINCGGPEYMHPNGILFQADNLVGNYGNVKNLFRFMGGNAYTTTATIAEVEGLEYGLPYQSERYGNFSYKISLPNGDYNVILGFAEIYPYIFGGAREFD
ncbi:MAG: malectin domain-containing carbohydrate-binding protein [Deltaproteobacteria bacterium]|nr:malectin domain-containing carbohydrate-binding protein [Deltaproteobacteria bacterium]